MLCMRLHRGDALSVHTFVTDAKGQRLSEKMAEGKIASCKFFGDGTGQNMTMHARVDFAHVRQADTQEVSRWHASASPWKTTTAARSMATKSASMTCLEGQRVSSISKRRSRA